MKIQISLMVADSQLRTIAGTLLANLVEFGATQPIQKFNGNTVMFVYVVSKCIGSVKLQITFQIFCYNDFYENYVLIFYWRYALQQISHKLLYGAPDILKGKMKNKY